MSLNGGDSWQSLQSNLPVTPVYDVQVKDGDLVVATHGRSFWVLDDVTPLRQSAESEARNAEQTDMEVLPATLESGRGKARLFPPRATVRHRGLGIGGRAAPGVNYTGGMDGIAWFERKTRDGRTERIPLNAGTNPPEGVLIDYRLGVEPEDVVKLEVLDTDGKLIREYLSEGGPDGEPRLPAQAGFNRWVWNLRYPDMVKLPGDVPTAQSQLAPPAPPGTYQVRLTAGGETFTERFEVTRDPRVTATREDLDAQFELLCAIRDKVSDTHRAVLKLRAVRGQVESWLAAAADADAKAARPAAGALLDKLAAAEDELVQRRARGESDRLNYPGGLNAKLVHLFQVVASADGPPTEQSRDVFGHLSAQVDEHVTTINAALANEGAAFNTATAAAQLRG